MARKQRYDRWERRRSLAKINALLDRVKYNKALYVECLVWGVSISVCGLCKWFGTDPHTSPTPPHPNRQTQQDEAGDLQLPAGVHLRGQGIPGTGGSGAGRGRGAREEGMMVAVMDMEMVW